MKNVWKYVTISFLLLLGLGCAGVLYIFFVPGADIFHITYILNPGAAFGMLEHKRWIFIIVALVIMAATIYCYRWIKQESSLIRCGIGLLLGGAAGNLLDRIQTGLVVDFLDFRVWPVFNIADIGICVGAGMLMFSVWRRRNEI